MYIPPLQVIWPQIGTLCVIADRALCTNARLLSNNNAKMPTHALMMITRRSSTLNMLSTERMTAVTVAEMIKPTPLAQASKRIVVVGDCVASVASSCIAFNFCGGSRSSRLSSPLERRPSSSFTFLAIVVVFCVSMPGLATSPLLLR